MTDLYEKALNVWQSGPDIKDDYHSSTGLISNSFIKSFKECQYNAVIEYARVDKEAQEFKQCFAEGHITEAMIFEEEPGFNKMMERYANNVYQKNGKPYKWVDDCKEFAKSVTRHESIMKILKHKDSKYHQTLIFDLYGMQCKAEVDCLNLTLNSEIDLKTTRSKFSDRSWNSVTRTKDLTFIDEMDYHSQRAFYQYGIKRVYDVQVAPHILAVSKNNKSVRLFEFDEQYRLDSIIDKLEPEFGEIKEVIDGEVYPSRCEECARCVDSEEITGTVKISSYCYGV